MAVMAPRLELLVAMAVLAWAVDPDVGKSMFEIVQERGYPLEPHNITTDDGYVLTSFRIPHGAHGARPTVGQKPVVFIQHALLCSSFDWVNNMANQSLAFVLADAGFDVWMGNNRGNTWGRGHTTLQLDSDEFWNFSWDDMALHDLPANIEYVLSTTGRSSLSYIGHSQGTLQAFAGFSRSRELSAKVDLFVALAPVAYIYHQASLVFTAFAELRVPKMLEAFGQREFLVPGTNSGFLNKLGSRICSVLPHECDDAIFLFCGKTRHMNTTRLPVYLSQTPAGTSVKNMAHFAQALFGDSFRMYDYGSAERNLAKYNVAKPPAYKLSDVTVKTALFTGGHDILADPMDVARLLNELPTASIVHHYNYPDYAHLDFAWAADANEVVYRDVIRLLRQFSGSSDTVVV